MSRDSAGLPTHLAHQATRRKANLLIEEHNFLTRKACLRSQAEKRMLVESTMHQLRLGVLGSGKGSNFRAIHEAIRTGRLAARIVLVCTDVADAGISRLAREAGIPTFLIEETRFRTRLSQQTEEDLVERLRQAGVDLVVLAGYMRLLKTPMLEAFPSHIINIHPSLLPKFRGLEAWRQALEAGETVTGCTVHFVDENMDSGKIIAQAEVPIIPGDTPESIHARIQEAEHRLYPEVVGRFARGELP